MYWTETYNEFFLRGLLVAGFPEVGVSVLVFNIAGYIYILFLSI